MKCLDFIDKKSENSLDLIVQLLDLSENPFDLIVQLLDLSDNLNHLSETFSDLYKSRLIIPLKFKRVEDWFCSSTLLLRIS